MAKLSPMILSQWEPVQVTRGTLKQPNYSRSKHSIQTSDRLKTFQSCVAAQMSGKKFSDRLAVRAALKSAAASCRGK